MYVESDGLAPLDIVRWRVDTNFDAIVDCLVFCGDRSVGSWERKLGDKCTT
jgi:hypothetical protein